MGMTRNDNECTVFDIERCATEDGPGIRTVVFFAGCNMTCPWCHNPEGFSNAPLWMFERSRCIHCGACEKVCPSGVHVLKDGYHVIQQATCTGCLKCVDACISGAIKGVRKTYALDELMRIVKLDSAYYHESGGGVTLSGGEVMLQHRFVVRFLRKLKEEGLSTAIETNLSFPWELYSKILPYADLVMADIKMWDEMSHKRFTGFSKELVLRNVDHLSIENKQMIIRTPVIAGINDDPSEIKRIAEFLSGRENLLYYELLPYHSLGIEKARKMGITMTKYEVPTHERMMELAYSARKYLEKVRVSGQIIGRGR